MKKKNNKNAFDPREDAKDKILLFSFTIAVFFIVLIVGTLFGNKFQNIDEQINIINEELGLNDPQSIYEEMNIPTYCNGTIIGINKGEYYDFYCEIK